MSSSSSVSPCSQRAHERFRDVGIFHEAVADDDLEHALTERANRDLLIRRHVRHRLGRDHQGHHVFVKHLVVAKIVGQRGRRAFRLRGHENGSAWHARGRSLRHGREKLLDRHRSRGQALGHNAGVRSSRSSSAVNRQPADDQRHPAAILVILDRFAPRNARSMMMNNRRQADGERQRPSVPPVARDVEREDGRDDHRARDRDPYAAASPVDDPKPRTSEKGLTRSAQLICRQVACPISCPGCGSMRRRR